MLEPSAIKISPNLKIKKQVLLSENVRAKMSVIAWFAYSVPVGITLKEITVNYVIMWNVKNQSAFALAPPTELGAGARSAAVGISRSLLFVSTRVRGGYMQPWGKRTFCLY